MKLFLIGLPGCGKSTLGKQIAHSFVVPFVDLDQIIERSENQKITEIFYEKGEDYFRKIESEQLKKWVQLNTDYVMATGGGTPCFFNHMTLMNQSGDTIFLDVSSEEIAKRMWYSKNADRPLLKNMTSHNLKNQIEILRARRIECYQQAHSIISSDTITLEEVLQIIKREILR